MNEAVATVLSSLYKTDDKDLHAFFSYLSESYSQGHLFVEKTDKGLIPHLEELDRDAALKGYEKLTTSPYIFVKGNRVYFEHAYTLTSECQALIEKLQTKAPHLHVDQVQLLAKVEALICAKTLLPEQGSAICEALKKCLSCIWGGPGTGKTYTAGWLVKLFLEDHPNAHIVLAAPTGKAAANLLSSINKVLPGAPLQAKTLHSLLGVKRIETKRKREELPYDLILVDESSMIDIALYVKLLYSVAEGARIIFLGDPFQLPPIEPGQPFADLVAEQIKKGLPGGLVTTKRQENRTIVDLAEAVRTGQTDQVLSHLQSNLKPIDSLNVKQLYNNPASTVESFFQLLLETRLLSPMRLGPYGTQVINQQMLDASKSPFEPIIITRNDYTLNLTNGSIGIIFGPYAYFENYETPNVLRKIPKVLLSSYETAYCLSVHKSQGSEFGNVILLLPEGSERFGRKLLYTAITRAKKSLTIYSTPAIISNCLETSLYSTITPMPE